MAIKSELVILIGNIGSGKSTISKRYAEQGYYIVCRDDFRYMLGAGKYIFNPSLEKAINASSISMIRMLLIEGLNIVVDETNVTKQTRKRLILMGKAFDYTIIAHELPRLTLLECLKNREKDGLRETSLEKWSSVWNMFNSRYEKPEINEGFDSIISASEYNK